MSQIVYPENAGNLPFGLANSNAPGSPYAAAYARGTTTHLRLPVDPKIFNAQPAQFLDLQYLMAFGAHEEGGDETIWHEQVWSRRSVTVRANFAGVALSAGTEVTGDLPIVAASLDNVYVGQLLYYNGGQVLVTAIISTGGAEAVTVKSMTGRPIPAATAGDRVTDGRTAGGDGGQFFSSPTRIQTLQRHNFLEKIGPESKIWDEIELQKWKNLGQTNYQEKDMLDMLTQMKVSQCQRLWFGERAQTILTDGRPAKFTEGIVPAIVNNGGAVVDTTYSTIWDDMIDAIFATNFMTNDSHRVVFAPPEVLFAMNFKKKAEFIRFSTESRIWDMDFEEWRVGGQRFTLVPTQIWGNEASFPSDFAKKVVIMPKENVQVATMRGVPMLKQQLFQSRSNITPAEIYDYNRYTVQGFLGSRTQNAASGIILQLPY